MTADLEIRADGTASMAYRANGGRPWHNLGTPVSDDMTPEEMMIAAGLNWEVDKFPMFAEVKVGTDPETGEDIVKRVLANKEALIRTSDQRLLSEVGKGWKPCQNAEAFDFFVDFVKAGDMMMDTAGALREGELVWALASVNDSFELFGGDKVNGYLLFSNPHQYGKSIDIKFVMERVVCSNTLAVALTERGQPSIKINHRRQFDAEKVKEILGIGHNKLDKFKAAAEFLGTKRYTKETLKSYMGDVLGRNDSKELSRAAEQAIGLIESQPGADFAKGSWWQNFNAVTYMTDHVLGRTDESRLDAAVFGYGAKRKLEALDLAIEYANAA